ncbi:glycosyltransferase family 4 protein [Rhizobium sp. P32RR-XVIII]|uniref:glycosyltransferase family 4 protein n=1 Tax=Rhizobium sp. P32RR-XVIII TaxID=2726738 RepID=UPI0014572C32|nr:glycosyltransferase family 4 protein [Rhizobium sp. P32RR-XVIII]NLS07807.1 glycosyltransferase family 4 protein [Rhizobium sp. P32RR-XVIII]
MQTAAAEPHGRRYADRIAVVIPGLSAGGTEHVVSLLANHWAASGYAVTVVTFEAPDTKPYYAFRDDVRITRLGLPPGKTSRFVSTVAVWQRIWRLRSAIRQADPAFVLSFLTRTNVTTLIAMLGSAIPIAVSERNNPDAQPFGVVWKWLRGKLYPRAFCLVTMTHGALGYFPDDIRQKARVIPNAVDLPTNWTDRRTGRTLTAVGRLTHQKGFDLLLQAFSKVADRHQEWKLVIWGEGEERGRLQTLCATLGLKRRVEMPGVTSSPGQWIETADVFVLSSRYEGWGIVLLEAMAAGIPVVSFECKWGPGEMVTDQHDGILVEPENVDALADALDLVLRDSTLREKLAENAMSSAKSYSQERVLQAWDDLVASALAASPRPLVRRGRY